VLVATPAAVASSPPARSMIQELAEIARRHLEREPQGA
jgi:hypothetical protein